MFATAADRTLLARQLARLVNTGCVPIAMYGAGRVLQMLRHDLGPELAKFDEHITGVIDDDASRHGSTWAGLEVISAADALKRNVKAVVICAEGSMQDALWAKRDTFLKAGMRVLTCPQRFAGQTWDDALINHYEQVVAGTPEAAEKYSAGYPSREDATNPTIVRAIRDRLKPSATICEIGSGAGKWTSLFIADAGAYHCVDYSARLLHEVIEHRFASHAKKLHLHHDEKASLAGVPDSSVDLVFSIDVFVHFKIDLVHQFLASIRRVLKPGGVALLHFADWTDAGIQRWQTHDTAHHNGGVGPIFPNHFEWLQRSARTLGLTASRVGEPIDWTYLVEFRK